MRLTLCVTVLMLSSSLPTATGAQVAAGPAPAAVAGPTNPAASPAQVDGTAGERAGNRLLELVGGDPKTLLDPKRRAEIAGEAKPLLRTICDEMDQDPQADLERSGRIRQQLYNFLALRVLLGDDAAEAQLTAVSLSKNQGFAAAGKGALLWARWLESAHDAVAQRKVLGQLSALARENPDSGDVHGVLFGLTQMGAASPELALAADTLAKQYINRPEDQRLHDAEAKRQSLVGKPLAIEGTTVAGEKFGTGKWAGRVVLVQFWATWCGPCLGEMPRVKDAYRKWHAQGLEAVGVSCDADRDTLQRFLAKNPGVTWPQLFEPDSPGWHRVADDVGVLGIPTMFLIDRKGVVRSVTARKELDELIPLLLSESAAGGAEKSK